MIPTSLMVCVKTFNSVNLFKDADWKKCSVKTHQTLCRNFVNSTIFWVDGNQVRVSVKTLKIDGAVVTGQITLLKNV